MMIIINYDFFNKIRCKITEIGKTEPQDVPSWGPGMRNYYMIHFVTSGEGVFNGEKVVKGQYFLTTPYTKITYYPNKENPWQYLWIHLTGEDVAEFLSGFGYITTCGIASYNFVEQLIAMQDEIFKDPTPSTNLLQKINFIANNILSLHKSTLSHRKKDIKLSHISRAKEFISANIHKKISTKNVAEFTKLDEKYLYSLFVLYEKCTLKDYINKTKIEEAKALINFSNMNFSEVAYSIGIDDSLYFSKLFKKYVGVSPREYRNSLK